MKSDARRSRNAASALWAQLCCGALLAVLSGCMVNSSFSALPPSALGDLDRFEGVYAQEGDLDGSKTTVTRIEKGLYSAVLIEKVDQETLDMARAAAGKCRDIDFEAMDDETELQIRALCDGDIEAFCRSHGDSQSPEEIEECAVSIKVVRGDQPAADLSDDMRKVAEYLRWISDEKSNGKKFTLAIAPQNGQWSVVQIREITLVGPGTFEIFGPDEKVGDLALFERSAGGLVAWTTEKCFPDRTSAEIAPAEVLPGLRGCADRLAAHGAEPGWRRRAYRRIGD